ncbi:UDP-4-amino-4,6-dideoxy-N-acetyl-beta-L-altrosamine transaminase [Patescibacteria group bacterium]|nr:UDP-4-amino-4,6-dideoxy-N-acetyl-beta-L-altrosamine transaminase [Patescibacteria group bacterium]
MIPYARQTLEEDDIQAVVNVLRSDLVTQGPKVEEFERALAKRAGTKHAVAFSHGTAALMGSFFAMGIKPGDEFITTPLTFCATSNAGLWFGAKPVFVDIEEDTGTIDPSAVEAAITSKTKAIVAVDYGGHPADLTRLREIAKKHNLVLIDDAMHALGATLDGKPVGSLADMTTFSFHPVKPICAGEGGAVTTDNDEYARRLRAFRLHGIVKEDFVNPSPGAWYYEMQELGLNAKLTDIQSALGLSQLGKLDRFLEARERLAMRYHGALAGLPVHLPVTRPGVRHGLHLFAVRLTGEWASKRDELFTKLREAGIGVQVHYIPVHHHPYYQKLGYMKGECPKAEAFFASEISLPLFPSLSDADQDKVINEFTKLFS